MRKKVFSIALAALLIVGTVSIAFSRGQGRRGGDFGPGFYGLRMTNQTPAELNLTKEQQEKLQSLRVDFAKETLSLRNEMQIKELELRQLWLADELDEEAIVAKSKEISALQNQLQEKQIRHRLDVAKVLTKEQRTRFFPAGYRGRGDWYGFGMGRGHR
ncbi:periplasmic heavy metal sensor [Candidatus Poribacteria bacterium]|nr:periplasmic heavy metal sensor [Candidatus Poribacteria bacterium]